MPIAYLCQLDDGVLCEPDPGHVAVQLEVRAAGEGHVLPQRRGHVARRLRDRLVRRQYRQVQEA